MCNPNLLINTDFRNPVNQRGQSSWNTDEYHIDMWVFDEANWSLTSEGIRVTEIPEWWTSMYQKLELDGAFFNGKTITISAVIKTESQPKSVRLMLFNTSKNKSITEKYFDVGDNTTNLLHFSANIPNNAADKGDTVAFYITPNSNIDSGVTIIQAAKLELGTFSTLANEVVDYVAELKKCQRYLQVIPAYNTFRASYVDNSVFKFNIPIGGMRINPSLSGSIVICGIDNAAQVDFIMSAYTTDNMIVIAANKNSHGLKDAIFATGDKSAILSAEL